MPVCEGKVEIELGPKKGSLRHARRTTRSASCGAMAEPGMRQCAIHLKASGYFRCACGEWVPPAPANVPYRGKCPKCGLVHDLEKTT